MTASPTDDLASAEGRIQELTKELSRARGELSQTKGELVEAREQQTATGGILRAISNSPTDLQGIFQEIATTAALLCDAYDAGVLQCAGDHLRLVALRGQIPGQGIVPLSRGVLLGRAILDRTILQVPDLQAETEEYPEGSEIARRLGHRTIVAVPLIRGREALGAIFVRRTEVRPFTDRQIDLLKTFADQAVIAIENTRLFEAEQARTKEVVAKSAELTQSLEYQTAISEVLSVISRSPHELQPVFNSIVASSKHLLQAHSAVVSRLVGQEVQLAAFTPVSPETDQVLQDVYPLQLDAPGPTPAAVRERIPFAIQDIEGDGIHPAAVKVARRRGYRSILIVPMLSKGEAIGTINVTRLEPGPFSDEEIGLLKTFADQAVIAIENTRLFEAEQASKRELQESLEYQTAISEVLNVISRSPNRLQPVFDVIAQNASRLCGSEYAIVTRYDGSLIQLAAQHNPRPGAAEETARLYPLPADPKASPTSRAILTGSMVHVPDVEKEEIMDSTLATFRRISARAVLSVPMLHRGQPIGGISVSRATPGPFSNRQIDLLRTFADQAVIAIENTRLFEAEQASKRDLTEALEQQTATADVLKVISRSALDLQRVLDALVESAARLCNAYDASIFKVFGDGLRLVANQGQIPSSGPVGQLTIPMVRGRIPARAVIDRRTIQVADVVAEEDEYPESHKNALQQGYRTVLAVPLAHAGQPIGVIALRRSEVRPFTDRQIELLQTFADQAVIAIENTRLFDEVQARTRDLEDSLEHATATSEVLKVISTSAFDLRPVLESLIENAVRLCGADKGLIYRQDADVYRAVVSCGHAPEWQRVIEQHPIAQDRTSATGRAVVDRRVVHIPDTLADPDYHWAERHHGEQGMHRTILAVPMLREGVVIGVIVIRRTWVEPFTDRQIELVTTFADQAVIAIENTRLFEAEQASKRELRESLEYQTATSDVLNVISRSTTDVQPVFDAIVKSAAKLFDPCIVNINSLEDAQLVFRATASVRYKLNIEAAKSFYPIPFDPERSVASRAILEQRIVEIPDAAAPDVPESMRMAQQVFGTFRSVTSVPLIREGQGIGVISLAHPGPGFKLSDKQLALVQTFADQAVIAIKNTQLFEAEQTRTAELQARTRELTESLEQQTATADVLKVISRSALDVQKVLDALVESAARLCNAYDAAILQVFGHGLRGVAHYGQIALSAQTRPLMRGFITGRAILDRRTIHVADILAEGDEYPESHKYALQHGYRTALAVPLVHAGEAIGVIFIRRDEVRPFTERQIELVNIFADQAVIAIENTRLFDEVQARTRELAQTVEDLEIASQHKNQFVANMSHELRTPLAAILGYAELIQEGFYGALPEKSLNALTRIRSNGKHLLGLINTVLDIAKIESGQFTLNMSEYAIESVVETVRAATESLAQNKKLTLTTSVDKSLPIGLGDEQRLTQVLLNLVGNAIKFTDTGEVSIAAGARNGHFAVSVTDTGPGIPLDQQDRIFEQFHQVDSSNTKAKGGTGLGLAIAKQIVEMHGGRIWVVSTPGKGSTFQMELPARAEFRKPVQGGLA